MIRLFVAIDFPEEIKEQLLQIRIGLPGARWSEREQMHLTLRFLGELDGANFKEVANLLSEIDFKKFTISLSGVGTFESRGMIKVIWVGVKRSDELISLQKKIERKLVQFGLEGETRKYIPHLTLARINDVDAAQAGLSAKGLSSRVGSLVEEYNLYKSDPIIVDQIHLYSSKLTSKKSIYRKEFSYRCLQ
ncbi:MAG: RNA 2',3'-cyclic phosphodiesterase [Oligoflexia bacterium]|nr:RNA 2',3'-cyclic phosphodiesterase [Oligoflexia bacterium]